MTNIPISAGWLGNSSHHLFVIPWLLLKRTGWGREGEVVRSRRTGFWWNDIFIEARRGKVSAENGKVEGRERTYQSNATETCTPSPYWIEKLPVHISRDSRDRHTRIDFLRLMLGVISTAKTAHNQGANNKSQKLFYKSYFARHFLCSLKALGNW